MTGTAHGLESDTAVLKRAADELAVRFVGVFASQTVHRYVFESYIALRRTANSRTHLVALTTRFPTDRLTSLAHTQGDM